MDFVKLLDFHNKENADATMCVREYKYQVPYGVVHAEDNRIVSMVEKPTHCYHVNTGIYIINPIVFNSVSKNKVIDMPTVLEEQIEKNKIVSMYTLYAYWLDVGRMDDFNRAQSDIKGLGF